VSILKSIYNTSFGLLTDLYQLTMAYGYWKSGMADHEAVFHLSFREAPFKNQYAICAGLATVIEYVQACEFREDDVAYLATLKGSDETPLFDLEFLEYLKKLRFSLDIDAIEEGSVVFPHEPLIRVKGSLLQCQILESTLLNIINFQTLIATKAARVCHAAQGDAVLEFGLRRAQGFDGSLSASHAAFLGGCAATSNVLAGKLYGIPVKGTHAHSWVMAFDTELEAFETYAHALPNNIILLVDTYHTLEGIKNAIAVGQQLKKNGHHLFGIRLDSGDLAELSIQARKLLDTAGFTDTLIVGSSDLDEYRIAEYKKRGALVNIWGVGTRLCTAYDQPAMQIAYKISAIRAPGQDWQYKMKISEDVGKISTPGILNVRRFENQDVIYHECTAIAGDGEKGEDLLKPIFRQGKLVYSVPKLLDSRERCQKALTQFQKTDNYSVIFEERLIELKKSINPLQA
jgi:nicotinate phosphoribosyltransferase